MKRASTVSYTHLDVYKRQTLDRNKLVFYFTADNRVDFRDLVKDLAGQFHTRIELRQICLLYTSRCV